jgi:hypothetical protein
MTSSIINPGGEITAVRGVRFLGVLVIDGVDISVPPHKFGCGPNPESAPLSVEKNMVK